MSEVLFFEALSGNGESYLPNWEGVLDIKTY